MKIGRNDSCHCGSGKKYKKCCLPKDEETAHHSPARREDTHTPPDRSQGHDHVDLTPTSPILFASEMDPYFEAWTQRWEEFEAADYEERIALFHQTLEDPPSPLLPALVTGMDEEMAFGMLNELFFQTFLHGERDRFDALTESLRERDPEVYAENADYILDWRITNALVSDRFDLAAVLLRNMAAIAHRNFELWTQGLDRMAYYGQLPALIDAVRLSWPAIRKSTEIQTQAIAEYRAYCGQLEILHAVEASGEPQIADLAFQERLRFYLDEDEKIDFAEQARWIDCLAGRSPRVWSLDDFKIEQPIQPLATEQGLASGVVRNLSHLSAQFIHYLHTEWGTSFAKAELARDEIYTYLAKRAMKRGSRPPRRSKAASEPSGHSLTLDAQALKVRMKELLDRLVQSPYRAAALMEAAPAWVRFLERQQLIDAEHGQRIASELGPLADEIIKILDEDATDPRISQSLKQQRAMVKGD